MCEGDLVASSEKTNKVVATSLVVVPLFGNLRKMAKSNEHLSRHFLLSLPIKDIFIYVHAWSLEGGGGGGIV